MGKPLFLSLLLAVAGLIAPLTAAWGQRLAAPAAVPGATDLRGFHHCQQAHTQPAGERGLAGPTSTSLRHNQLMSRYDLLSVKMELWLTSADDRVGAGSYVEFRARNTSALPLDTVGFELNSDYSVSSILVDSSPVNSLLVALGNNFKIPLVQPIAPGSEFTFQINYVGSPYSALPWEYTGLHSGVVYRYGNKRATVSNSTALHAADWYPCKQILTDQLDSAEIAVITDQGDLVASNGLMQRVDSLGPYRRRYVWKTRYPIAYNKLMVAVGQYVSQTTYAHLPGLPAADSVPIIDFLVNDPPSLAIQRAALAPERALLEYFSGKIAPYPFWREKAGICLSYGGYGMESQTMITVNPLYGGIKYSVIAHELFHHWFGNSVRLRSWRDNWLSEGMANYGEYLAIKNLVSADTAAAWLSQIQPFASPLPAVLTGTDTLMQRRIFDSGRVYNKGTMVLHMLHEHLGSDSLFFAGLRAFYQQYAGRTASSEDFQRSLESTYGMSLGWFFDQWVYGEGFPIFDARWNQVGQDFIIELTQSSTSSRPLYRVLVDIEVRLANGPSEYRRVESTQPVHSLQFTLPPGASVNRPYLNTLHHALLTSRTIRRDRSLLPTGVPPDVVQEPLHLFPNPCAAFLELPAAAHERTVEVLDLSGRRVKLSRLPPLAGQLSTATLSAGTYMLRLTRPDGSYQQARFSRL